MTTIIAYTGVQGSGKSTAIDKLRNNLPGKVIVIEEVARSLGIKLDHESSIAIQTQIWHKQLTMEMNAQSYTSDWILCDRTLLDNLMYLRHLCATQNLPLDRFNELLPLTQDWMHNYDVIVRFPLNEDYILNDSDCMRSKNLEYARKIDKLFDVYIQPYVTVNL